MKGRRHKQDDSGASKLELWCLKIVCENILKLLEWGSTTVMDNAPLIIQLLYKIQNIHKNVITKWLQQKPNQFLAPDTKSELSHKIANST